MQTPGPLGRLRPRPRTGLSASTAACLGTDVAVAVPLQRRSPARMLALSVAELAALVVLIVTTHLAALVVLAVLGCALIGAALTNRHRVLAVTSAGVVLLAASARGRPLVPIGPAPAGLTLPEPAGLGAGVVLDGTCWWVERNAFPRLRMARSLLGQGGDGGQSDGPS